MNVLTTSNINSITLELFNVVLIDDQPKLDFEVVNSVAMKVGYIVHPEACTQDVYFYLKGLSYNPNSTFYKNWKSVTDKNRFELLLDQIKHYLSTYGTDFTGEVYVPETEVELPNSDIDVTNYTKILPVDEATLIARCEKLFTSGIALAQKTIDYVITILAALNHQMDANTIKNREAKMFYMKASGQYPSDPIEMVRYLVYLSTDETLLIKSKEVLDKIKSNRRDITEQIAGCGLKSLSEVYNRFKPIFLAFKNAYPTHRMLINRIGKYSKKHHNGIQIGFWERVLSDKSVTIDEVISKLTTQPPNNFKIITLLRAIAVRKVNLEFRLFRIRNQKLFISDKTINVDNDFYEALSGLLLKQLQNNLSAKAGTFYLHPDVKPTLPASEKSFVGNYPIGTRVSVGKDSMIMGINWKGSDGANDLDLSITTLDGTKYGWDSAYYNASQSLVFSGDMTSANPEATEAFYAQSGVEGSGLLRVNIYDGAVGSKAKLFVARDTSENFGSNYVVDPSKVIFMTELTLPTRMTDVGVLANNELILMTAKSGNAMTSRTTLTSRNLDYMLYTYKAYLDLRETLISAGFTEVTDPNEKVDYDFRNMSKDTLISILS